MTEYAPQYATICHNMPHPAHSLPQAVEGVFTVMSLFLVSVSYAGTGVRRGVAHCWTWSSSRSGWTQGRTDISLCHFLCKWANGKRETRRRMPQHCNCDCVTNALHAPSPKCPHCRAVCNRLLCPLIATNCLTSGHAQDSYGLRLIKLKTFGKQTRPLPRFEHKHYFYSVSTPSTPLLYGLPLSTVRAHR